MRRKIAMPLCILLASAAALSAQSRAPLSLAVSAGVEIPFGPVDTSGEPRYSTGGGVSLSVQYLLPFATWISVHTTIGYAMLPLAYPSVYAEGLVGSTVATSMSPLSLMSLGVGAALKFSILPWMDLELSGTGGLSGALLKGTVDPTFQLQPCFSGHAGLDFWVTPAIGIGVGAGYRAHREVLDGLGLSMGAHFRPQPKVPRFSIEVSDVTLKPVFPVFYKYYDDHPVGSARIRNSEKGQIQKLRVSFYVEQYMSQPKECVQIEKLERGAEVEVPLYGLFRDTVLKITEDTKVPAQILIEYTSIDTQVSGKVTKTLRVHHRNAMSWDDSRKAAAFVVFQDPQLLRITKSVAGAIRGKEIPIVDPGLRDAIGLFEFLRIYGVNYVADPSSSYAGKAGDSRVVDYLQFPVETLSYKAGDCDDLSILYAAMLESVGVETAFITTPGHILVAFCLTREAELSKDLLYTPEKLALGSGKVWVPVEVTMVKEGFLRAWQEGAREWKEYEESRQAALLPIHEAWGTYEPVAGGEALALSSLDLDEVAASWVGQLTNLVEEAIERPVDNLLQQISSDNNNPRLLNRLGVLYGRYGLYDKAVQHLDLAAQSGYAPALLNLGNIAYLRGQLSKALDLYKLARRMESRNANALLGIARVYYRLGNYSEAEGAYRQVQDLDTSLAGQNRYLANGGTVELRGAMAGGSETVAWVEE